MLVNFVVEQQNGAGGVVDGDRSELPVLPEMEVSGMTGSLLTNRKIKCK